MRSIKKGEGMQKALIGSLMLLALLQRPVPCQAGLIENILVKVAMGSCKYILTHHPILVASVVIYIFRHQLKQVVGDNFALLVSEYPIISFALGISLLKVVIDLLQPEQTVPT